VRRAGLIAAGTVGVIVLAGATTWLVTFRDTAEPVTVDEAVTSFRTDTSRRRAGLARDEGEARERALLQELADRWSVTLRAHAEHWAAVYPTTWHAVA